MKKVYLIAYIVSDFSSVTADSELTFETIEAKNAHDARIKANEFIENLKKEKTIVIYLYLSKIINKDCGQKRRGK